MLTIYCLLVVFLYFYQNRSVNTSTFISEETNEEPNNVKSPIIVKKRGRPKKVVDYQNDSLDLVPSEENTVEENSSKQYDFISTYNECK